MIASYRKITAVTALVVSAAGLTGCAAGTDTASNTGAADDYAGPQVTLQVTNATCQAGHCDSIDVRLYPEHQLITPAGFWSVSLGIVTGAKACLMVPMSSIQRVIGSVTEVHVNPDGTTTYAPGDHPDTTMVTWTPSLPAALGETPPVSYFQDRNPATDDFTPGNATGWSVTLPGGQPVATARCTG